MNVGLSLSSTHLGPDPRSGPRAMIERARVAYAAGFSSLSVGDHHNMGVPYVQNSPILGRLLAEWSGRPAGLLFLMPLWHPLLAAEHIGTLAAIHDGPFIVQTGIGHGEEQFRAFGTTGRERGRRIDESIPLVKRLLAGETVDSATFSMEGAHVGLRPPEQVEWWIGAGVDTALDRAARLGDVWYAGPGLRRVDAAARLDVYRERCRVHGVTPRAALRRDVLASPDGTRARQRAEALIDAGYRGLTDAQLVYGGPAEVAEQLHVYAEMGFDEVVMRCMSPDQAVAMQTIETVGELMTGGDLG